MKIAVAGATGRVGKHVVDVIEAGTHEVVAMSRASGVDVISGKGLAQALKGVEAVIDVASGPSPEQDEATDLLCDGGAKSSARSQPGWRAAHDRDFDHRDRSVHSRLHGRQSCARESHARGPVPVGILRAAQFHEFVETLMQWGRKGDVTYVPKMRTQLVAARTVAEALVTMATDSASAPGSAGELPLEIGGPKAEDLVDAARRFVARRGERGASRSRDEPVRSGQRAL